MKTYKIHLIRHGKTSANSDGVYIGHTDLPLSPEGLKELLALKTKMEYPGAARFFSAPLTRCKQTMEVLYPGTKVQVVEGLTECDFGDWENKSIVQLKNDPAFLEWMEGTSKEIPGGESTEEFRERVTAAFEAVVEELLRSGDTEAVICTHGGVIMMLMMTYALPKLSMSDCVANPGNGFTLRITPSLWMREPVAEALCMIPWERENTELQ